MVRAAYWWEEGKDADAKKKKDEVITVTREEMKNIIEGVYKQAEERLSQVWANEMKDKIYEYENRLAEQGKKYEMQLRELEKVNEHLKYLIGEKGEELERRKRAQGGAARILQLEAKVKKLEAENMALECELGEVLEMLSDHESEEEEVGIEDNVCGKWLFDKGECAIFRDKVTGHLSYEEPVGDNRLHGWLVAQKDREASAPCWHAQLSISQENEHPRYGLSFGEKPEYVGDIQVHLLPGEGMETRIKFMDEDGVKDSDWQPPTFWTKKEEMSDSDSEDLRGSKEEKEKPKKEYSWDAEKARAERSKRWRAAFGVEDNYIDD